MTRSSVWMVTTCLIIVGATQSVAQDNPRISCDARVPRAYQRDPPGWKSPTGESEATRYKTGYRAFCWNCVMVKAQDLKQKCPFVCSGTPAATAGCNDGARSAEEQVASLLEKHQQARVVDYLSDLARSPRAKKEASRYFRAGPRVERATE